LRYSSAGIVSLKRRRGRVDEVTNGRPIACGPRRATSVCFPATDVRASAGESIPAHSAAWFAAYFGRDARGTRPPRRNRAYPLRAASSRSTCVTKPPQHTKNKQQNTKKQQKRHNK